MAVQLESPRRPGARRAPSPRRPESGAILPALRLVEPSRTARRLAVILATLFVLTPCALVWLPWRQSVSGAGRVVGYAPLDRQYNIEAPIYGRVQEWYVAEGTKVVTGQPIARISDNDSDYLAALESQRDAALAKFTTAESEVELYKEVTARIEEVREMAVNAAENYVEVSRQKVQSEEQEQAATLVARDTDWQQFQRLARLFPQGLASRRDLEVAEQKYKESAAKLGKAEAALRSARIDVVAKGSYLAEVKAKTQADIEKNRAETQKAMGKVAEAQKELQDARVKIRRQETQQVVATRDGTILRLLVNQGTEQVKDGDPIAVLVPDASELAVELLIDGNDTPLVLQGDPVRLQFEGWPAVQFAGWPSVAVGTFGGRVALVDSADDGKGKFRIMVVPAVGEQWPSSRYLRQGVRAKGWVLLREVRVGYELWRRMNGFPQVIAEDEPGDKGGKDKPKTKRPK